MAYDEPGKPRHVAHGVDRPCPECDGTGVVECPECFAWDVRELLYCLDCDDCRELDCPECEGTGEAPEEDDGDDAYDWARDEELMD